MAIMNNKINVLDGQNIMDIALQEMGAIEGIFEICQQNNLGIGEMLATNQILEIPKKTIKSDIVRYLALENVKPNTGQTLEAVANNPFGFAFSTEFGGEFS
jgi:hypothetical protein